MTLGVWSALSPAALSVIHEHVMSSPDVEVGGFIVGTHGDEREPPQAIAAIAAHAAQGDPTRLTFTHEAWKQVHRELEDRYPDQSIVGWYHSHPGHGIFLSEHDRFIHRNFFPAPWQIAVVVDPVHESEGLFVWARGDIELASERELGAADGAVDAGGGTAFTMRSDLVPRAQRRRLLVEVDDPAPEPVPTLSMVELPATEVLPAPRSQLFDVAVHLEAHDPYPRAARRSPMAEPAYGPADAAPLPRARRPRPERYPIAGHLVPIMAGLGVGVAAGIAFQSLS